MNYNKKAIVMGGLAAFMILGIAASQHPYQFKNLKVLPKNISEKTLDTVMNEFTKALKVDCDFCHVKPADSTADWDMASDARPEKNIARKMIAMSNKINKDFFNATTKYGDENAVLEIHCITCHHGQPHPEMEDIEEQDSMRQTIKQ
jgi:hypothetical protein